MPRIFTMLLPSRIVTSNREVDLMRSRAATTEGPFPSSSMSLSSWWARSRSRATSLPEKNAEAMMQNNTIAR